MTPNDAWDGWDGVSDDLETPQQTDQDTLAQVAEDCAAFADAYDSATAVLGCHHVPALPAEVDRDIDSGDLPEIERDAAALAKSIAGKHFTSSSCHCRALPLVEEIGQTVIAFADALGVARAALETHTGDKDRQRLYRETLAARIGCLNRLTTDIADRVKEAQPLVSSQIKAVRKILSMAAEAGFRHVPTDLFREDVEIENLSNLRKWVISVNGIHALLRGAVFPQVQGNVRYIGVKVDPISCCGMFPASTASVLVTFASAAITAAEAAYGYARYGRKREMDEMSSGNGRFLEFNDAAWRSLAPF